MSFDNIISFLLNSFDSGNKEKNSEIHIGKKFTKNNNSSVLKIILLAREGEGEAYITKILIRRLHKKGYSSLSYFFPKHLPSSNANKTINNFDFIKNQIKFDILKIKTEHNFQKIDIIAPSLSVVSACLIANDNDNIQNLFLLVPSSCLASSLWNGIRTQKLKNTYEHQNINQEDLKNRWKNLAPKRNINTMRGKNIFIAISKSDKVIPYHFGKELTNLTKKLHPNNTIIQENTYIGHYFTVIKYYLFNKELLK